MKLRIFFFSSGTVPQRPSVGLSELVGTLFEGMLWREGALQRFTHTKMDPLSYLGWAQSGFLLLEERRADLFAGVKEISVFLELPAEKRSLRRAFFTSWWQKKRQDQQGDEGEMEAAIRNFAW